MDVNEARLNNFVGHEGHHEVHQNSTQPEPMMAGENVLAMQFHGVFMLIGWWIFLPAAMITARYFRQEMASTMFKSALWFHCHRTMALIGVGCVVAGLVSILVHTKGKFSNDDPATFTHAIVGIIAIAGVFIQPFVAIFRCSTKNSKRSYFNWFHRMFGVTTWMVSQAAIVLTTWMPYTGLTLGQKLGEIPRTIIIVYWVVILLVGCCMELCQINYDRQPNETETEAPNASGNAFEETNTLGRHAKRIVAKSILFNLILIAGALFSALMIYFIFEVGGKSEDDA